MLKSTIGAIGAVLACLAFASVASPAGAAVHAGVVGGGIHMQYGPQDTGGNYMGIASESYDFYSDALWGNTGWGDFFPTWSGNQRPPDGAGYGYVLLAFNPYTGEVWSDIPNTHQALNPAGTYSGHTPSVSKSGPSGLPDDPGTPGIDESIVQSDVVQYDYRGFGVDCVYITAEFLPRPDNGVILEPFGSFVNTSSDGGILSADPWVTYNTSWGALLPHGAEVKPYAASAPDRPVGMYQDENLDLDFDHNKTWGFSGFWNWAGGWYAGDVGGAADNLFGFEMDGNRGWMRLDFSGNHSGVRLTEYYFDVLTVGDFDGDGDVDSDDVDMLCANIGGDPATYDVDGDGDVDEDDMTFHVENYLEYDSDGDGTVDGAGTFRGDFNTDGTVNGTDLSIMSGSFGGTAGFASGNANCDATVNGTDLSILSSVFGNVATAAIPEPATMSLVALGAIAILRRKRN
jgi:hypothetical protein